MHQKLSFEAPFETLLSFLTASRHTNLTAALPRGIERNWYTKCSYRVASNNAGRNLPLFSYDFFLDSHCCRWNRYTGQPVPILAFVEKTVPFKLSHTSHHPISIRSGCGCWVCYDIRFLRCLALFQPLHIPSNRTMAHSSCADCTADVSLRYRVTQFRTICQSDFYLQFEAFQIL